MLYQADAMRQSNRALHRIEFSFGNENHISRKGIGELGGHACKITPMTLKIAAAIPPLDEISEHRKKKKQKNRGGNCQDRNLLWAFDHRRLSAP